MMTSPPRWFGAATAVATFALVLIGLHSPGFAAEAADPSLDDPNAVRTFHWEAPSNLTGILAVHLEPRFDGAVDTAECSFDVSAIGGFEDGPEDPPVHLWIEYRSANASGWVAVVGGQKVQVHAGGIASQQVFWSDLVWWGLSNGWTLTLEEPVTLTVIGTDLNGRNESPLQIDFACDEAFTMSKAASRQAVGFTRDSMRGGAGLGTRSAVSTGVSIADRQSTVFATDEVLFRARAESEPPESIGAGHLTLHHPQGQETWWMSGSTDATFRGGPGAYEVRLTRVAASSYLLASPEETTRPFAGVMAGVEPVDHLDDAI